MAMTPERRKAIEAVYADMDNDPYIGFTHADSLYNGYLSRAGFNLHEQWLRAKASIRELLAEIDQRTEPWPNTIHFPDDAMTADANAHYHATRIANQRIQHVYESVVVGRDPNAVVDSLFASLQAAYYTEARLRNEMTERGRD